MENPSTTFSLVWKALYFLNIFQLGLILVTPPPRIKSGKIGILVQKMRNVLKLWKNNFAIFIFWEMINFVLNMLESSPKMAQFLICPKDKRCAMFSNLWKKRFLVFEKCSILYSKFLEIKKKLCSFYLSEKKTARSFSPTSGSDIFFGSKIISSTFHRSDELFFSREAFG